MAEQKCPGEQPIPLIEDIEQLTIRITKENLDLALKILREVLDEEAQE